jgi:N-methylhydantoinase A
VRIAIDTGGTFTDCVARIDGRLHVLKLRSTPADPGAAVLAGVLQLSAGHSDPVDVRHGTTVGTNAMLERKGARVAFVTTTGFEDTIAIGRQTRPLLYAWTTPPQACLVEPAMRFGVPERVTAEGAILRSPTEADLAALAEAIRNSCSSPSSTPKTSAASKPHCSRSASPSPPRTASCPSSASTNAPPRSPSTPTSRPRCRATS